MKDQKNNPAPSTFQELTTFLKSLNTSKNSGLPLLKKEGDRSRLILHLEKQFDDSMLRREEAA